MEGTGYFFPVRVPRYDSHQFGPFLKRTPAKGCPIATLPIAMCPELSLREHKVLAAGAGAIGTMVSSRISYQSRTNITINTSNYPLHLNTVWNLEQACRLTLLFLLFILQRTLV